MRVFVSILLSASLLFAQPSADWQRVQNLPAHTSIAIKTKSGVYYHGNVIRVTSDSLALDSDERGHPGRVHTQRDLRQSEIREIRRFNQTTSTLAAVGIGAAVGAGIGIGIDASARSNEDQGLATAVFTFLGALLGWAIGRHTTLIKGERIYVAP